MCEESQHRPETEWRHQVLKLADYGLTFNMAISFSSKVFIVTGHLLHECFGFSVSLQCRWLTTDSATLDIRSEHVLMVGSAAKRVG